MNAARIVLAGLALGCALLPAQADALVDGERHRLFAEHRVFGGAVVTGNTLMTASIAAPEVNSGLLPRSLSGIPSMESSVKRGFTNKGSNYDAKRTPGVQWAWIRSA